MSSSVATKNTAELVSNPISGLSKDYELAYKNLDQDSLSRLLSYKSEYLSNINTLLSETVNKDESENNGSELLKELINPEFMDNIIDQYHSYFSNIKFTYLEQTSKEKFLRNVVDSKFITVKDLETLKFNMINNKKKLQTKKQFRDDLLIKINEILQKNYLKFEKLQKLQEDSKSIILKSKNLLEKIDKLEKENVKYYDSESNNFEDDEIVLKKLHLLNDLSELIQESKEDSLVYNERQRRSTMVDNSIDSSIVSNFDDYLLVNSSNNLNKLIKKRKLNNENIENDQENLNKKIKLLENNLNEKNQEYNILNESNTNLKKKINENHIQNELIIQRKKENGQYDDYKQKIELFKWLTELDNLLKKLDQINKIIIEEKINPLVGESSCYRLKLKRNSEIFSIKFSQVNNGFRLNELTIDGLPKDKIPNLEKFKETFKDYSIIHESFGEMVQAIINVTLV